MNIAQPLSTSVSQASDAASAHRVDPGIGSDATDLATPDGSAQSTPFGGLLARQIGRIGSVADAAPRMALAAAAGDASGATIAASGTGMIPAVVGEPFVEAMTASSTPTPGLGKTAGRDADSTATLADPDDDETPVADAGAGLAAQLALVSQWAAIARPATTPEVATTQASATVAPQAARGAALDIQAKLDAVRANASAPTGANRDTAISVVAATPEFAAFAAVLPRPFAPAAAVRDVARGEPPIVPSSSTDAAGAQDHATSAVTRKDDLTAVADAMRAIADGTAIAATATSPDTGPLDAVRLLQAPASSVVPATTAVPPASTPDRLHEAVGTPAWSHEVGQAALRIAGSELQSASLRLNPEHLGPLDVQLRVERGVAHVAFHAAHAETRAALEGSRTTLDQMFQGQGLRMGDVSVATGDSSGAARFGGGAAMDASRHGDRSGSSRSGSDDADGDASVTATISVRASRVGLVDTFA